MQDNASKDLNAKPASVVRSGRTAFERLSADAERLKKFSELQSLKTSRVEVSVDTHDLLEVTKCNQARTNDFATLEEMMILLRLMAAHVDQDNPASAGPAGFINRL